MNNLSSIGISRNVCLFVLLLGLSHGPCQAQLGVKMSPTDVLNAANKSITTEAFDKQPLNMAFGGQSINAPAGKYGISVWNVPVYEVYVNRLENNIDLLISTLNDAYPQRKTIIDKLLGVAGGLTYGFQLAVGTQTGQPESMTNEARQKFMNSITESLTLDFYIDSYQAQNQDSRISFFESRLVKAATASGQYDITQYAANLFYSGPSGKNYTRTKEAAITCTQFVDQELNKTGVSSAIGQAIAGIADVIGQAGQQSPSNTDVNNLFKVFTQVKGGWYWKQMAPGSVTGFLMKQLPGATLAADVVSQEGIGSRYADEALLPNKLYPSPFALQSAKSPSKSDFSGVGVITVPGGISGVIDLGPGTPSGNSNSSGSSTPPPPIK